MAGVSCELRAARKIQGTRDKIQGEGMGIMNQAKVRGENVPEPDRSDRTTIATLFQCIVSLRETTPDRKNTTIEQ
jgi:hypothetical protein